MKPLVVPVLNSLQHVAPPHGGVSWNCDWACAAEEASGSPPLAGA